MDSSAQRLASQSVSVLVGTATQLSRGTRAGPTTARYADLFECVLFKVLSPEEWKLDDRFRLGFWLGKTARGDDHLIFDGDDVRQCRTVKRRPEYFRWDRERVDAVDVHPQRTRPPRQRALHDRPKRYITWAYIRKYGGTPNCKACAVDGPSHSQECRERFEAIFLKEEEEKALMDAAAATAASMAHQDEASTNPDTAAHPGTVPMNVEFPKDAVVPETSTGGAASSSMGQFVNTPVDMEITETELRRSEFEEVPESRKVRRINGLAVCSMDMVGAAQADYDNPQLSGEEFERKADEESSAVHTHEGEPMKSFEVPTSERDIIGVKSGVLLDPANVQAASQKESTVLQDTRWSSW